MDPSGEMLHIAKNKVKNVEFYKGYAEDLPYEVEKLDFIATNFAFHHFENKNKALDEIKRVLKKEGIFSMLNISPQHIKSWWVYQYFPNSIPEDKKRFWTVFLPLNVINTIAMSIKSNPKSPYLFPAKNPKKHIADRTAYNILQKYLKKADINSKPFHALRSTCIKIAQKKDGQQNKQQSILVIL